MTNSELPTIEECHAFMKAINDGREALGLERITTLEYDESEPGDSRNCLSARHLFTASPELNEQGSVGQVTVYYPSTESLEVRDRLVQALHTTSLDYQVVIPLSIKRVTDVFDGRTTGLRERFVEAGLVAELDPANA